MPVPKADLQVGMILWLRKAVKDDCQSLSDDHHGQNSEFGVLGIEDVECDRPVAIVDTMPENEHRVWVCPVRASAVVALFLTNTFAVRL